MRRVIILLCLAALSCAAQSFAGAILGTIRDPSRAVVPQATVTVVNTATNARTEVRSGAAGNYIAPLLPPGQYRVEVEAQGFKKFVRDGIVLQVQQQALVDVALDVGAITESVLVTAQASLLEATTSSVGKVVDNRRLRNLPLNSRNVYALIFLTPGVAGSVGNFYGDMRYSVNGARLRAMDQLIDGVSATHPTVNGASGISVFPSVDAIEEYKVMGANYPAEFGRSQGNVLNLIYKSGANDLHGSVYEFLRNSVLDSNNFFANRLGQELISFKRSQFGGMASGPIRRDKLFFMGSYEGLRQRGFTSTTNTVPTALERQGDFSRTLAANGQLIRVFDPFTTRANPAGGFIRDAVPGNVIPASRFDPVAVNVLKYMPPPNTAGNPVTNQQNYYQAGSRLLNTNNLDFRVDYNLSSARRFFARYSHRGVKDYPPELFPKDLAIAEGRINEENRGRNAVVDYTHTVSPTTILVARLGFARSLYVYGNQGLNFVPSSLGLPRYIDANVDRLMFPSFGLSGYRGLGGGDHRWNAFMTYTAQANATKILGARTLKFGYEGRLLRVNTWEARSAGSFGFSAGMTQGPNPSSASATAGNSIASLLLGAGSSGNYLYSGGWKNAATQNFYHGFYLQDDWRATSKLTLNLGVRYELESPRTERYNRTNYFDPFAPSPLAKQVPQFPDLRGGLVFVGVDGRSRHQYNWDKNNLSPRLGLAYQLTRRTVIRAAYGHMFSSSPQAAQGTIGTMGFRSDYLWVNSLDGITPYNLLKDPYPGGLPPSPGASLGLLTQAGSSIQAVLRDTVTPWSMQWNFTVQHELPAQILLETAYVGTRGLQLTRNGESGLSLNQLYPEHMALGSRLNETVPNPFYGIVTGGVHVGQRVSRGQLLRPYPQFTDVIPLISSGASSTYHSLQVTATKRMSHGLLFEGSYTWAKLLDNGDSHQNSYDLKASRSLASYDIAHRLVMSYIYELPFGRGRRFGSDALGPVNWLLGGWQFNGITAFQTGTPLSIGASNTAGLYNPKTRANNNGKSGKLSGPVHERLNAYFDKTVFSQPPPFAFGNLAERLPDIRDDGIRNFDLSIFKEFAPREQLRVQFRAEFFNAFNTPRFSGPNTSVTSSSFGVISSQSNSSRQTQFGLKLLW
ncbi:MAG: TonB-dependent receptor [Acidobacteriota bacterium]